MDNLRIRGVVDTDIFDYGPEMSRLLVRAWRELVRGQPISVGRLNELISDAGIATETTSDFLRSVTERDAAGAILGVLGLSLNDHPHRFTVNGVVLATWCAVDTLFLPAMLGQAAVVDSTSPLSGRPIRVVVKPDEVESVRPAECVVSLPIVKPGEVDTSCSEGIRRSFCHRIHFFADRAEAEQWVSDRGDMEVVSVAEARAWAMATWSVVLPYAQELGAG